MSQEQEQDKQGRNRRIRVVIEEDLNGQKRILREIPLPFKKFSSGSDGFYGSDKIPLDNGEALPDEHHNDANWVKTERRKERMTLYRVFSLFRASLLFRKRLFRISMAVHVSIKRERYLPQRIEIPYSQSGSPAVREVCRVGVKRLHNFNLSMSWKSH